ncbi:hypothetical protein OE749_18185 [Aestuariibacter sp. AA17]|uniref:G8 domain-containing protein n=1 Tax=Fluctibacter corallii TaxID=2984329 RepID=A0ABT3AD74_9ALTE|nr:G8 domain-containing protein [Aestuariibacter sp. AA17]MCV2886628.1 hypothetical protein [Aestuariibacter sp. AA17]
MKKIGFIFLAYILSFPSTAASYIKGYIDSAAYVGSEFRIRGWACQTSHNTSIKVHVYAGGPAGTGSAITSADANLNSEPAVASACGASGSKYRFDVALPRAKVYQHAGKALHVHGISPIGSGNKVITNSGKYSLPTSFTTAYIGSEMAKGDFTIPAGIDVAINSSATAKLVHVQGRLSCASGAQGIFKTEGILVNGSGATFQCGTSSSPFTGDLTIELTGARSVSSLTSMTSSEMLKAIVSMNGGHISLNGKSGKQGYKILSKTASAGSRTISLTSSSSWQVGDEIVIAPTGFDPHHAEKRTITGVANSGRTITLNSPLSYSHWGTTKGYSNGSTSWTLDERAEVANLTRNITIRSANDSYWSNQRMGATVMAMMSGKANINNVELFRVGQAGRLGRYPFHWHILGNVSGQAIENTSIHDSQNRCVVIHGSQYARVERNTCYNHFGHGYFLEDGNETNNIIRHNLGMLSKRVDPDYMLLQSEVATKDPARFPAPSTFWVSHPTNDIRYNVAAGSEGTGFWMSFKRAIRCTSSGCLLSDDNVATHKPSRANTLYFSNNTAHSSVVGMTWDGASRKSDPKLRCGPKTKLPSASACPDDNRIPTSSHYEPSSKPTFSNLRAHKNSIAGIYIRGDAMKLDRNVLADNIWSGWFAFDQELVNSLVVGQSANSTSSDLSNIEALHNSYDTYFQRSRNLNSQFTRSTMAHMRNLSGLKIYDGPFLADNVLFAEFASSTQYFNGQDVTPAAISMMGGSGRYLNYLGRVSFDNSDNTTPLRKIDMNGSLSGNWTDPYTAAVRDVNASITNKAGDYLLHDHPMNYTGNCHRNVPASREVIACDYELGHIRFAGVNYVRFSVTRKNASSGVEYASVGPFASSQYSNKFNVIMGNTYHYEIDDYSRSGSRTLQFSSRNASDVSPLISVKGGSNCYISGISRLSNLSTLKSSTTGGYVHSGGDLYFKLKGGQQTKSPNRDNRLSKNFRQYTLRCN